MAGDSHTNFNSGAFTAGAVGGSLTIAGALVAGAQNAMAGARSSREQRLRDDLFRTRGRLLAEQKRRRNDNRRNGIRELNDARDRAEWAQRILMLHLGLPEQGR